MYHRLDSVFHFCMWYISLAAILVHRALIFVCCPSTLKFRVTICAHHSVCGKLRSTLMHRVECNSDAVLFSIFVWDTRTSASDIMLDEKRPTISTLIFNFQMDSCLSIHSLLDKLIRSHTRRFHYPWRFSVTSHPRNPPIHPSRLVLKIPTSTIIIRDLCLFSSRPDSRTIDRGGWFLVSGLSGEPVDCASTGQDRRPEG